MKKALLIIDVQNDYFENGKCRLHQPEAALKAIQRLLKYFRDMQYQVYYIQHIAAKDAPFFVPDTEGIRICENIKPLDAEKIIKKHYPNSFFETELQEELKKSSVTELTVCGMMTHMCVDTTVRAAKDLGYQVTLISDACATKDLEWQGEKIPAEIVQNVFLASLNQKFATIMTVEDFMLVSRKENPA